jgi:phage recombination protein Bet
MEYKGKNIYVSHEDHNAFMRKNAHLEPSSEEVRLHYIICDQYGAHPLSGLIHFTRRKGIYTPIASIDFFRARAEETGAYAGSDDAIFTYDDNGKILSATVTVWKIVQGHRCPFTATARWAEYAPENINDKSAFMWRKMPHTMLAKCAEALALRKAFPAKLHNLYIAEEMAQAGVYVQPSVGEQLPNALEAGEAGAENNAEPSEVQGGEGDMVTTAVALSAAEKMSAFNLCREEHVLRVIAMLKNHNIEAKPRDVVKKVYSLCEGGKKASIEQVAAAMLADAETQDNLQEQEQGAI